VDQFIIDVIIEHTVLGRGRAGSEEPILPLENQVSLKSSLTSTSSGNS
jgi:hypothetical protein